MRIELFERVLSGAATTYGESVYVDEVSDFVVSAVAASKTGTNPTLDVTIQDSPSGKDVTDANATWFNTTTFTQFTDNGGQVKTYIGPHFGRLRVKAVVGGTSTPGYRLEVVYAGKANDGQYRTNR